VQKITGSLQSVPGISNQPVKMGCATFNADQAGFDAAHAAVGAAGFKSHERVRSASHAAPDANATKADAEHKRATPTSSSSGGPGPNAARPAANTSANTAANSSATTTGSPGPAHNAKNEHPVVGTPGKPQVAPAV
jgi:hypothetical protein